MMTIVALMLFATPNVAAQQPTVCERLAPQLKMRQQPARGAANTPPLWRVNMLGGVGAALFGGTFNATFLVEPVDPDDTRNPNDMCASTKGNMLCRLEGPVRFSTSTKAGEASVELAADERAEIGLEGRHMICRDFPRS